MCEAFSYQVLRLKRVRIMNIRLGDLKPGAYRKVTEEEWKELKKLTRNSSETTVIPKK